MEDIIKIILWLVIGIAIFVGWFWVVINFILKTGNFTYKKCHKKISQRYETEKNLCKWCKDKKG
ncbi:hypothetical protein [endosymbiont GvMRE of Glomus versiforme]|uniref:hypothetical protein n=1 Tax=endosymbiont GvMRE of Glomus versiforme TaxID=2039283 RepID=UPI000EDFC340|nr:hypothetical protein [endosymbiont GvMRE of Glomus versiforme]RHZ36965.1 hypothetical protein GvMRE_I2g319 [endosymbiont GvMRE of Glomus versiforme]